MTPAEARDIDRHEFEAECAAIRQRAYELVQRKPSIPPIPHVTPKPRLKPKHPPKPKPAKHPNAIGRPADCYSVGGITLTLSQWAARLNVAPGVLHTRFHNGWTVEEALTTPKRQKRAGVGSNLPVFVGTGGGSTAQETTEITFPEEANS